MNLFVFKFIHLICEIYIPGLISLSERDVLKAKKGGRKRRTAAGQSNFYNDYFQHSAVNVL